jgi:hypothetical protein
MNSQEPVEDDIETAMLADLPLASAQAEETKGGSGVVTLIGPPVSADLKKTGPGLLVLPG